MSDNCLYPVGGYKKQGIKQLEWVDITNNKDAEIDTKKTNKDLLRRLHVKSDGKIFSGAKAFIVLWGRMPKFKFLGKLLSIPIIFHIFSLIYEVVAFFLYLKNRKQLRN